MAFWHESARTWEMIHLCPSSKHHSGALILNLERAKVENDVI